MVKTKSIKAASTAERYTKRVIITTALLLLVLLGNVKGGLGWFWFSAFIATIALTALWHNDITRFFTKIDTRTPLTDAIKKTQKKERRK